MVPAKNRPRPASKTADARRQNNDAVKRCREKKKMEKRQREQEFARLQDENKRLEKQVAKMEKERLCGPFCQCDHSR
uniref:BZIP domain-containing protein n=1 Tax=Panagrolaimus sp. JU765 TaxID=591449 RepID=A0AC34R1W8_9BILA